MGLTRQAGAGMSQVARDISVGSNQLLDGGASTRVMGKPFQGPVYLERQELLALKRELARVTGIERRLLRMGQVPAEPRAIDNLRLIKRIREHHTASDGVMGALRMLEELTNVGTSPWLTPAPTSSTASYASTIPGSSGGSMPSSTKSGP